MSILDSAELLLQAKNYSGSGNWLDENNSHDGVNNGALFKAFVTTVGQYVYMPGTSSNFLSTPDASALDITGDIDIRVKVSFDDITPATDNGMLSKYLTTGDQRSYKFGLNGPNDALEFGWSPDGGFGNAEIEESSVSLASAGYGDGDVVWVRVTLDVDNGSSDADVTFYTSADGVSWTQLGTVQSPGATTSIFASTAKLNLGVQHNDDQLPLVGAIYEAQVYSGIDGTLVFDARLDDATEAATFTERSSNAATVTINRSSSGLMSTVIDESWFLYTTNDYHEIADSADLDFSGSEDLTTMVMFRTHTVASGSDVLLAKKDNLTTAAGYALVRNTATGQGIIADGTADDDDTVATVAVHTRHTLAMVRNTTDDDVEVFLDGVSSGSPTTDSTTVTLANALPLRIGATSGTAANFLEGEVGAVAGWRRALTADEVLAAHVAATVGVSHNAMTLLGAGAG